MLKKLALFSIFELFCLLLTSSLSKYASKRGVEALNFVSPPLVDFFHEMLPFHEEGPFLSDVCVLIIMGIFLWAIWRSHSVIELTIEFLGLHSILLLLRITSITLTILPSPVPVCRDIQRFESCSWCKGDFFPFFFFSPSTLTNFPSNSFLDIRDLIPTLSASYCNDLMFSGHTMTMLLCTLFTQNSNIHFVAKILSWFVS